MLQWYSTGIIIIFLFVSFTEGQLKEKAEELRLLLDKKTHRKNTGIHPEIKTIPSSVIDSSLYQEWFSGNWENRESTIYTYNNYFTEEIFVFRRFNNNIWNPEVRTARFYNENNDLMRETIELYDNNNWAFIRQKFVSYSDGLVSEELYQDWNGDSWINNSRYSSKYDENKNQVEILVEKWAEIWVNDMRYTMLYDNNNNNTLLLAENWIESWQNLYKTEKVFNEYNLVTLQDYYQWENSIWQQIEKITNSYGERFELTEAKLQLWIENSWVNELLTTFLYDSITFKLSEATDQRWNAAVEKWMNELHYIYKNKGDTSESIVQVWSEDQWINNFRTLTENGNLLYTTISMSWDGQSWVNSARFITAFKLLTSFKEPTVPVSYKLEQNFPNPFNPSTIINYSLPEAQPVILKVYNILGQEISTLVNEPVEAGKHQVTFNASGLSSGIYYYRLETPDFTETKGMIMIK